MIKLISIIIPIYNEEKNIPLLYNEIKKIWQDLKEKYDYEIIFVDDGSEDESIKILENLAGENEKIKVIQFSRNFGKEAATSAGIYEAKGDAVLMIDADLQHPPELIPKFIEKWEGGADIVIGVRRKNRGETMIKKIGSLLFYKIMNFIGDTKIMKHATDFRLIDKMVVKEFNKFTEKNRMTRGLLDWLGFKKDFIYFKAFGRRNGKPRYSNLKLTELAFSSFISYSFFPLKLAGYLGILIVLFSGSLGIFIFIGKYILNNSWAMSISGPAMLAIIILFLVGIVLICLGIIALYIANIQNEAMNRPLYVIKSRKLES